jgi:heme/copper-type cytochrome/quinol oxidase subunit 2
MDIFFALIWGILFLIFIYSAWVFLFHSLHENMHKQGEQAKTNNKLITAIVLLIMIVVFLKIAFGNNS